MFIQCNLMKTECQALDWEPSKQMSAQRYMRYFSSSADWFLSLGLSNPAIHGSFHRLLFSKAGTPDPLGVSCVHYHYFFLCSQLCLGRWLCRSPEAFGQQLWWWCWRCWAPQRLRAETLHVSAGQLLPEPPLWGPGSEGHLAWGVISEYFLSSGMRAMLHSHFHLLMTKWGQSPSHRLKPGDIITGRRRQSVYLLQVLGQSEHGYFVLKNFSKEDTAGLVISGSPKTLSGLNTMGSWVGEM